MTEQMPCLNLNARSITPKNERQIRLLVIFPQHAPGEYWEQIDYNSMLLLELADSNILKLSKLADKINQMDG